MNALTMNPLNFCLKAKHYLICFFLSLCLSLAEESPAPKKESDLSAVKQAEAFMKSLASSGGKDGAKFLVTEEDIPKTPGLAADSVVKMLNEQLSATHHFFELSTHDPKFQKFTLIKEVKDKDNITWALVRYWGFEPDNSELEKGEITLIKSKDGPWKVMQEIKEAQDQAMQYRLLSDYLASQTDLSAKKLYLRLFDANAGSITDLLG